MSFKDWASKLRCVDTARNPFLGSLVCHSCGRHDRFSAYDKVVGIDRDTELHVHSDGRVEVMCVRTDVDELLRAIAAEVPFVSAEQVTPFGCGVAVPVAGGHLECASCGSREFRPPVDGDAGPENKAE